MSPVNPVGPVSPVSLLSQSSQVNLTKAEKLARLRLWRTPRVGPASFRTFMARFGTAVAAVDALPDHAKSLGKKALAIPSLADAVREIEALYDLGGRFVFSGTPEFPDLLEHIADAPPLLATLGNIDLLHRPQIALVGSRDASLAAKQVTRTLAADLGAAGFVITSGLAKGIDAAAHEAALPTGTIAVVAGGIDMIYPKENAALHRQIAEHGLIITEQALGTPTRAQLFPLRNRLVSGLSLGLVVTEATTRSGSLISARLAGEQGREVFAVPGSPLEERSQGANHLLKQGAHMAANAADVIEVLGSSPRFESPQRQADFVPEPLPLKDAKPLLAKILENLSTHPVGIDALIQECEVPAHTMKSALADLELMGDIHQHPGGQYSRAP